MKGCYSLGSLILGVSLSMYVVEWQGEKMQKQSQKLKEKKVK